MPIVIVLLSSIVAFLFGGSLLGVTVLLIGLAIVFPNIFGVIAAALGVMIGLALLEQKFDIDIGLLFVIIPLALLAFGGIFAIINNSKKSKYKQHRITKEEERQEKLNNSKQVIDNSNITCNPIKTIENGKIKYSIEPNTDDVWYALCDYITYHGENIFSFSRSQRDLKYVKVSHAQKDEEITLNRNEKEILLVFKNIENLPYFVPHTQNKKQP